MMIVMTTEELDCIKEQAFARAEEVEWQLRREIARLNEVANNMLRIVAGEAAAPVAPVVAARRQPPPAPPRKIVAPPPRYSSKAEELRAELLRPLARN